MNRGDYFGDNRPDNWKELDALPRKNFKLGEIDVAINKDINGFVSIRIFFNDLIYGDLVSELNIFLIKNKIRELISIKEKNYA